MKKKISLVMAALGLVASFSAQQVYANAEDMGLYTVTRLTDNDWVHDMLPSLASDSSLVWQRQVCDEGENPCRMDYEIFRYTPAEGMVRVTNNDLDDIYPEINESGTIVWMSRPDMYDNGDDWEVWRQVPGGAPIQMTDNDVDDKYPQVSANGNIVWNTFDGADWEISYARPLVAPQETEQGLWSSSETLYESMNGGTAGGDDFAVTNNNNDDYLTSGYLDYYYNEVDYSRPFKDNSPRMSPDGKIAWMSNDGNDFEVWTYDPAAELLRQITDNEVDDRYPQINSAGDMTWEQWDGNDFGISYVERNTMQERYISVDEESGNVWDDLHPKLSENGDVAWQIFDGNDWEIGRYSAATGLSEQLTNDSFDHLYHSINNNGDIAWMTWAPEINASQPFIINLYNNTIHENIEIASYMNYPTNYPRLNDNREVVWEESEWQRLDIVIAKPNNPFHIRFLPNRLNKKSKKRWLKAVIELPAVIDAATLDPSTIRLQKVNGTDLDDPILAEGHTKIADFNGDGVDDLYVWFEADDILDVLEAGTSELLVAGRFWDTPATPFYGTGLLKVKGKKKYRNHDEDDDDDRKDKKRSKKKRGRKDHDD